MTLSSSLCVSSSVTMTSERVSGSIWIVASPSWVLLGYWCWPLLLLLPPLPPEPLKPVRLPVVLPLVVGRDVLPGRTDDWACRCVAAPSSRVESAMFHAARGLEVRVVQSDGNEG